ncbi:MAG: aspartate dehydrogenase [Caldimonas sp.]
MLKLAVVGFGAIGRELARWLQDDPAIRITQVVVPPRSTERVQTLCTGLGLDARVLNALDLTAEGRPDAVAECAGHDALSAHIVLALQAGIPCAAASVGALHEAGLFARLEEAARSGRTRLQLVTGAVGAIDALAAARIGGLDEVRYVGTKPPRSWLGTPAEQVCDLATLEAPRVIFTGSAREAALAYPKNANVAATVGLAGLGLDRTQVELVADPGVARNTHRLSAYGAFGRLDLVLENLPLPDNPKTSALTAYSMVRAVRDLVQPVGF